VLSQEKYLINMSDSQGTTTYLVTYYNFTSFNNLYCNMQVATARTELFTTVTYYIGTRFFFFGNYIFYNPMDT
jgi:hypothetical protein